MGQKIQKSSGLKNLWNQINQFHEKKFFLTKFHFFFNFKNGQKSFFELGKGLKCNFTEKNLIYLISRVFFTWIFKIFLAAVIPDEWSRFGILKVPFWLKKSASGSSIYEYVRSSNFQSSKNFGSTKHDSKSKNRYITILLVFLLQNDWKLKLIVYARILF